MVGGWAEEEGGSDLDTNVIQGRKHEHESFIVGCGIKTFIFFLNLSLLINIPLHLPL